MADPASLSPSPPAWTVTATSLSAFLRGIAATPASAAGLILAATGVGFGALARDLGYSAGHVLFICAFVFALPAQVLVIDELARGAGIAATAVAVGLSAVRLLPMTVSLMPLIRDEKLPRWLHLYAVHFIAITAWLEGSRLLPPLPARVRLPYFAGLGSGFMALMSAGALLGFLLSARLPPVASAALLLMTPIYFTCSLLLSARGRADYLAVLLGGVIGPVVFYLAPGFDLLAAGVIGGTLAYLSGRRQRQRPT